MVSALQTPFGHGAPPFKGHGDKHIITTNFPNWSHILRFIDRDPEIMGGFRNMYPRVIMQKDVVSLCQAIIEKSELAAHSCLIFPAEDAAQMAFDYATSTKRGRQRVSPDLLAIKAFDIDKRYWVFLFPIAQTPNVILSWINPGLGISTREAETALQHIDRLRKVNEGDLLPQTPSKTIGYDDLKQRIVDLLARSPLDSSMQQPSLEDVYLFQTGMAAIYRTHEYLTSQFKQKSVVYGFPFHSTYHIYDDFGEGFQFYGLGDESDLRDLEAWLGSGNKIQALFCEFPSNPMVVTPDITRLRGLADQYGFFLIIDDTVGSFCNVDLAGKADAIITSLTKSFSGYADVMGGSLVLNPRMERYKELKNLVDKYYHNDLNYADAEVLLSNSADYLPRSTILNRNSMTLATYFHEQAQDPSSPVKKVYYPPYSASKELYEAFMRPATSEFTPGYGCLMSIEFKDLPQTIAFHDALDVFKAPHLGAHCTLALPYVKGLFAKELEWVGKFDMRETMMRVAPGLEDEEALLQTFKDAVEAARKAQDGIEDGVQGKIAKIS